MNCPLNPKAEMWKWGPAQVKIYYGDWAEGFFIEFPKLDPRYSVPPTVQLLKGGRFCAVIEMNEVRKHGNKLFLEKMVPRESREKGRKEWKFALVALQELEKEVEEADLVSLSLEAFLNLWRRFHRGVDMFWAYAVLPELSNFCSIEVLSEKIAPFVPEADRAHVLEVLTAPEGLSFYQEEEIDLAETADVEAHQQKYFWINNSYDHVEVATVAFFTKRKEAISKDIREEMKGKIAGIHARKEEVQKQYELSPEVMVIAETIEDALLWQDTRKGDIWRYLHDKELLLLEAVKRTGIDKGSLLRLLSSEIADVLEGNKPEVTIESRKIATGMFFEAGKISIIDTADALRFWDAYVEPPIENNISEFRGVTASKGNGVVQGRVRIVLDPRVPGDFQKGDVLVTSMTTPEYVFLMKDAGAVVTDTGGLTSHAAIVSRELGVPCIVGTKVATRALKNGDMVEVDAVKGIVRKIYIKKEPAYADPFDPLSMNHTSS